MGSKIDPTSNIKSSHCETIDSLEWYASGGLASVIVNFWGFRIFNNITVKYVEQPEVGKRINVAYFGLAEWLNLEFKRLNVNKLMIDAYIQSSIAPASPIAILTSDGLPLHEPLKVRRFNRVELLQILDPTHITPADTWEINRPIDHNFVSLYRMTTSNTYIHADRLVPFRLSPLLPCEIPHSQTAKNWGRPAIKQNTIDACLQYEIAVKATNILIQKKNFLGVGIKGYLRGMSAQNSDAYAGRVESIVRSIQSTSNLQNVGVYDTEEMNISSIERNLSGINTAVDKIKEYLLGVIDDIPESYLLGTPNTGLSNSSNELERIDGVANSKLNGCLSFIYQIMSALLKSSDCPFNDADIAKLFIHREPLFDVSQTELANNRLTNARAEAIEISNRLRDDGQKIIN
jgi:hypothetical protein